VTPGREMSKHYFSCLGGIDAGSTKRASGRVTLNFCFCMQWDLWVT
jgi:hypothetical protein